MTMDEQITHSDNAEQRLAAPSISLPKGGGAIRGMGEKFAANPVTGTGSLSVPIATSPGSVRNTCKKLSQVAPGIICLKRVLPLGITKNCFKDFMACMKGGQKGTPFRGVGRKWPSRVFKRLARTLL